MYYKISELSLCKVSNIKLMATNLKYQGKI